ncbi:MAG TPA: CDP-alcohol phosphatidyltransferase family protein [Patescibacteria group bacterium]|nr:CDP-alcohol phosphatidyltransferase family protein [Patescibacteria group bacterium]
MKKNHKPKFNAKIMHKPFYPFFERVFYRPIASVITPGFASINLSPTFVNFLGFGVGLIGIGLIAYGNLSERILGAGILIISYIFDCVDGQLARGFKKISHFGALLDTSLDSIKESLVFFALAWANFRQVHNDHIFFYLALVIFLQRMFGRTLPRYQLLFNKDVENIKKESLKNLPKFLKIIAFLFSESYRSGTIWIVVFIGVILNQIVIIFYYFIVVLFALFMAILISAYRQRNKW